MSRQVIVWLGLFSFSLGIFILSGCEKKADSDSEGAETLPSTEVVKPIKTIADIPKAQGPVVRARGVSPIVGPGTKLADADDATIWTSGKSRAMCELSFMTRELFLTAGVADQAVCVVGELEKRKKFVTEPVELRYDRGENVYYEILIDGQTIQRMNFKLVKDPEQIITDFSLYLCLPINGILTQTDGIEFSSQRSGYLGFKSLKSSGTKSWWSHVDMSGELTLGAQWKAKTFNGKFHVEDTSASKTFDQYVTAYQYADDIQIEGYSQNDAPGTLTDSEVKLFGQMTLINPEAASTLAVGDGTSIGNMIYGHYNVGYGEMNWNGSSRELATTSPFNKVVSEYEPVSVLRGDGGVVTPGFGQNGVCDDPSPPNFVMAVELTNEEWTEVLGICAVNEMGPTEARGEYSCGGI